MKILTVGDVVGSAAVTYLSEHLRTFASSISADLVVVNGENASDIHGLSAPDARALWEAGADLITLGNHAFGRRDLYPILEDAEAIIRPANFPPEAPGCGYTTLRINGYRVLCINVQGVAMMEPLACPFATVDRILEREAGDYDIALVDIHAEATSEKLALGRYLDGRVSVIFGTHTHVPTADEQILPRGSGYITDIGMTGAVDSIIGTETDLVITRFRTKIPTRFRAAVGTVRATGALFDVDESSGRVRSVRRITF